MARVTIGPIPAATARAWLDQAERTLSVLESAPQLGVPAEISERFGAYLRQWRAAAQQETFEWQGDVEPAEARELAAYWLHVVALAREQPERVGFHPAPPEGEGFYVALVEAITAVSAVGDPDGFAEKFEELVPDFIPDAVPAVNGGAEAPIRVLVVDDTEDIRLLLRFAFDHDPRFTVVAEAQDGRVALDACGEECPDAVVLDLMMPVMDGFTALPLLREQCPDTKVIVLSADTERSSRERAFALGADEVLSKATTMRDLTSTVATLVRG